MSAIIKKLFLFANFTPLWTGQCSVPKKILQGFYCLEDLTLYKVFRSLFPLLNWSSFNILYLPFAETIQLSSPAIT